MKFNLATLRFKNETSLKIYKLISHFQTWEKYYTFKEDNDGKFWIQELKGLRFDSESEMKEFAFVNWCNQMSTFLQDSEELHFHKLV